MADCTPGNLRYVSTHTFLVPQLSNKQSQEENFGHGQQMTHSDTVLLRLPDRGL